MRTPALPSLERTDRVHRNAGDGGEFFLREARRLAERLQLRGKGSRSARFHDPSSYRLRRLYELGEHERLPTRRSR